jgi:ribose transport system substrate-binding protein
MIRMSNRPMKALLLVPASVALLLTAACGGSSSDSSETSAAAVASSEESEAAPESSAAPDFCGEDATALQPQGIVGEGPNGEPAASPDDVALTDEEAAQVKAGNFTVGLVFQFMNDWSKAQIQGLTDTFDEYGVKIISTTDAQFKVDRQIADIENTIQQKPSGIITIPVDDVATAPAYAKVSEAGIKLVFMDNAAKGLTYPDQYQSVISADSQGNGQIAAAKLSCYIPEGGTIGVIDFGITFFVTNQRTKGVKDWFAANRPDVTIKEAAFTDPDKAGDVAANFLTANPDVQGVFAVWDGPAQGVISALRAEGKNIPVTTIDLGDQAATELAGAEYLKGLGAQRPYDQGVAEALALMNAFIGKTPPAWIGVPSLAVIQKNVLPAYQEVYKREAPKETVAACEAAAPACG